MVIVRLLLILMSVALNGFLAFLLLTEKRYDDLIEPLAEEDFPIKDIYGVGFRLIELFKITFKSKSANNLREKIKILYGDKYAEYYLRIIYAQRLSISYLTLAVVSIVSCFASGTDGVVLFAAGLILAGAVYYHFGTKTEQTLKKRSVVYISDFPDAISTIALLVNSGMVLRDAWAQVAFSNDKPLHMQMRAVTEDMKNGVSESDALYTFSLRCATPEIKKFTSFIIQGLEKGNRDLAFSLKNQSNELWEMKRQSVLQQGQLAASKLLIPIFIMFIGILIMVMGPIMTNLGV